MIHLHLLTFFSLIMASLSLWIYRSWWIWLSFSAISVALALKGGVAQPLSAATIGVLLILHLLFYKKNFQIPKNGLFIVITALSLALNLHAVPGFSTWNIFSTLKAHFDKPFIGFFILALFLPLISSKSEWILTAKRTFLVLIGGLIGIAAFIKTVSNLEPVFHLPPHFFPSLILNLFLIIIPEEAFFRGFFQEELHKNLGSNYKALFCSILATSVLYTLCHLTHSIETPLLGYIFLSSIVYGCAFHYTRRIESSIICRFIFTTLQMLFFYV